MEALEQEIYKLAGHPFNIASLKQLRQVLFDELKLPVKRRTGTTNEPSTDQETLEELAADKDKGTLPRKLLDISRMEDGSLRLRLTELSAADVTRSLSQLVQTLLLLVLVLALLTALISFFIGRRLSFPLRTLTRATARIGR